MRTRVGYAGGSSEDPTYYNISDHSEAIQIDYDPTEITYQQLLDIFWNSHNPEHPSYSRQYKSMLFFHNEEQRQSGEESKKQQEDERQTTLTTEIAAFKAFYLAEDYHQKYYLKQRADLMAEFDTVYSEHSDIANSTAAARINGYLAGYRSDGSNVDGITSFCLPSSKE